jgi:hypothetical protein
MENYVPFTTMWNGNRFLKKREIEKDNEILYHFIAIKYVN